MAHPTKRPLSDSPRYRSFIHDRDKALEKIHQNCQMRITDILGGALQRVMEISSYWYAQSHGSIHALSQIDQQIEQPFKHALPELVKAVEDMRARVYTLSYTGEAEAIARSIGKPQKVFLHQTQTKKAKDKPSPSGGQLNHRVALYLDRIRHKIADAIKVSAISDDPPHEALDRIRRAFPRVSYYTRPKKLLKDPVLKESDDTTYRMANTTMTVGFIDPMEWDDMINDYQDDYQFTNRGPDGVLDEEAKIPQYEWELEKDVTQDFVQQVRDGQMSAANDNGITDFVWIAIIDNRTDECCVWRNGLTSSEILLALQGDHADDECDTEVPPAHFNCRCSLAPMTDDMPDATPTNTGDFQDWLDQTSS